MASDPRRRALIVGLGIAAVLGMLLAWWLTPSSDPTAGLGDADDDWPHPPVDGVRAPPLRPPPPPAPDTGEDSDALGPGDTAAGSGEDARRPEPAGPPLVERPAREVLPDGWDVDGLVGSFPPDQGQVVDLLLTPDGRLLAEASRSDGSVVLWASLIDGGPAVPLTLEGVPQSAVAAARARDPRWVGDGVVVLAEDAAGTSRVWRVDDEGHATPLGRDDLPGSGRDLDGLAAAPGWVAVRWREQGIAVRPTTASGAWRTIDPGADGVSDPTVIVVDGTPRLAFARRGRLLVWTPDRTTPESVVARGVREPVLLADGTVAWPGTDAVLLRRPDGRIGRQSAAVPLPGPDVVRAPDNAGVIAWLRPDGFGTQGGDVVVPQRLDRPSALAVAGLEGTWVVAVAGRERGIATVALYDLFSGARLR